jgi:tRNA pseudouridine synthase 10
MHVMAWVQALCWCSRPLTGADVEALMSVKDLDVSQDTPVRVLHRRAPKVRG